MARPRAKRYVSARELCEAVREAAQEELEQRAPTFPEFRTELEAARERQRAWRDEMDAIERKAIAARAQLERALAAVAEVAAEARTALRWCEDHDQPMRVEGEIPQAVLWAAIPSRSIEKLEWLALGREPERSPTILGDAIRAVYIGGAHGGATDRIVALRAIVDGYMPNVANPRAVTVSDVLKTATKAAKIEREKLIARTAKQIIELSTPIPREEMPSKHDAEIARLRSELRALDAGFHRACESIEDDRDGWECERELRRLPLTYWKLGN